jgi:hypothetical protein
MLSGRKGQRKGWEKRERQNQPGQGDFEPAVGRGRRCDHAPQLESGLPCVKGQASVRGKSAHMPRII